MGTGKAPNELSAEVANIINRNIKSDDDLALFGCVVRATSDCESSSLNVQINLLFRVSMFSITNHMTSQKLAGAMQQSLSHHSGNQKTEAGLSLLIKGAADYFPVLSSFLACYSNLSFSQYQKQCRNTLDKERRRLAYTNVLQLQVSDHCCFLFCCSLVTCRVHSSGGLW